MKAITLELILTSARTRGDGSLGLAMATPELRPEEKTAVFELQGHPLKALLQPMTATPEALVDVKKELDTKTQSQRLRAVLFVEYRQKKPQGTFDEFYGREMDTIIESRKARLEPE